MTESAEALKVFKEIRDELRRLNDDRSQWYREVLGVLSAAKNGDEGSPVGSGQPAAAPDGQDGSP